MKFGSSTVSTLKLGSSSVSKVYLGATEVWSSFSFDANAAAYFAAITAAGSSISASNQLAVDAFVKGCKADGIWTAIKACCLLAGPDDLTGALVPLVGAAPTNNGPFVSGDYNRTTGLLGNGSSKYLDSNRSNSADPQNNFHIAVWATSLMTTDNRYFIGSGTAGTSGASHIRRQSATAAVFQNRNSSVAGSAGSFAVGFFGTSRTASNAYVNRGNGTNYNLTTASATPANDNFFVFATNAAGTPTGYANSRLTYYSIGESLDLALLDARLTSYMAALT